MGDAICPPQGCPERTITNKQCNKPLDPWGDHAVTCPTGPSRIARHDLLNITWLASLKTAGFHARAEVKVDPDTQRRAADRLSTTGTTDPPRLTTGKSPICYAQAWRRTRWTQTGQ